MQSKRKNPIWKNKPLLIGLAVVLVIGGFLYNRSRNASSANETTYEFGEVSRGDVRNSVSASGTIQPWRVVDIKSNVAGRVDRLTVDLGDRVEEGQLIALIDPTESEVAVSQAKAGMASSQANIVKATVNSQVQPDLTNLSIRQAEAGLTSANRSLEQARQNKRQLEAELANLRDVTNPLNIEEARNGLNQAEANLKAGQAEFDRQKALLEKGYASQGEVDSAAAQLATLQAAARNARQRASTVERQTQLSVQTLQARIGQAEAAIDESKARVDQQEAALRIAQRNSVQDTIRKQELQAARADAERTEAQYRLADTNLGFTRILAPRDGVVIQKNVEEGTVVPSSRGSIGSTNALLQLGDISTLWVVCQVDETDIAQIKVGQQVNVRVDAYPRMRVKGEVIRIDPQAKVEQSVTTIPVTVQLDEANPLFKPAMNAECEFVIDEVADALTIPVEALVEDNGETFVQKLVDGKPENISIEVGVQGQEAIELKSGDLKEGDSVITRITQPQVQGPNNPLQMGGPPGGGRGGGGTPRR